VSDGPEWFAPKRYGIGAGLPISWQGWVALLVFLAITFTVTGIARHRPEVLFAVMVPVSAVFLLIVLRTTRGGWRWRWGDED
jgi:hypothetical protein